jgi:hypothetical protein
MEPKSKPRSPSDGEKAPSRQTVLTAEAALSKDLKKLAMAQPHDGATKTQIEATADSIRTQIQLQEAFQETNAGQEHWLKQSRKIHTTLLTAMDYYTKEANWSNNEFNRYMDEALLIDKHKLEEDYHTAMSKVREAHEKIQRVHTAAMIMIQKKTIPKELQLTKEEVIQAEQEAMQIEQIKRAAILAQQEEEEGSPTGLSGSESSKGTQEGRKRSAEDGSPSRKRGVAASQLQDTRRDPDSQEDSLPPSQTSKTLSQKVRRSIFKKPGSTADKKPAVDKMKEAAAKASEKYQADKARQTFQTSAAAAAKTKLDQAQAEHQQIVREAEKTLEEAVQMTDQMEEQADYLEEAQAEAEEKLIANKDKAMAAHNEVERLKQEVAATAGGPDQQ